jgi:hypothetical protein
MTQHRKHRGYRTQRVAAEHMAANGFPHAEPVGAGRSGTDITGVVGVDIEVKARRGLNINALMSQLDERAQDGLLGVGIIRPDGMGETSVGRWPVVMCFDDWIALMRAAGYGMPPEGDVS